MINNLMLQTTSEKIISSTKTRLKININKPIQISTEAHLSPIFARKRQASKSSRHSQQRNSKYQKSKERELKYSVKLPPSPKSAISVVESEVEAINLVTSKMQDSQKTVYRDRSIKKNEQQLLHSKRQQKDRSLSKRGVDINRRERSKSPWMDRQDQNYIYWKKKAHEYLQHNIKLMNQVRRLTKDNQRLNNLLQQSQLQLSLKRHEESNMIYSEATLTQQIRNISSIYINKIEGLQKQLKRKDITISGYDIKIKELSSKLSGDSERIKLIVKLQHEIQKLKEDVSMCKNVVSSIKVNSRLNESTEVYGYDYYH